MIYKHIAQVFRNVKNIQIWEAVCFKGTLFLSPLHFFPLQFLFFRIATEVMQHATYKSEELNVRPFLQRSAESLYRGKGYFHAGSDANRVYHRSFDSIGPGPHWQSPNLLKKRQIFSIQAILFPANFSSLLDISNIVKANSARWREKTFMCWKGGSEEKEDRETEHLIEDAFLFPKSKISIC